MIVQHQRPQRAKHHRGGQSLILMFFILIALVGVMALTLDFGFVLLARRQMQTGVNSAALEGLRGQGLPEYDNNDELVRRENARGLLRLSYDDDLDLPNGNDTTVGAGIDSSLIQGNGFQSTTIGPADTTLAEDLANRSSFIFRPDNFQLNQDNLQHGDMVIGTYDTSTSADHVEFADYSRMDFVTDGAASPNAFLIRMRRTRNPELPDGIGQLDDIPDVSSGGGGLPLLLGRMSSIQAQPDDTPDFSVRRDGVTVRATAIAEATPARYVGVANAVGSIGLAPLALNLTDWQTLTTQPASTMIWLNNTTGDVTVGTSPTTAVLIGTARPIDESQPVFVGEVQEHIQAPSWTALPETDFESYVPVFAELASTDFPAVAQELVIGFARIQLTVSTTEADTFVLTPLPQIVAAENATSVATSNWPLAFRSQLQEHNTEYAALNSTEQAEVLDELINAAFAENQTLANDSNGLLAPALRQTMQ